MALLESVNVCAICEAEVRLRFGGIPSQFCTECFTSYRDDILAGAAWIKFLRNIERQRRKRRNRHLAHGANFRPLYTTIN